MTTLESILKSRDITLPTKVRLVKAMVFPVVMYGCESWTVKKAECQRNDAFEPWCWRRLLRVPWTERRSNQSILKETSPECSLGGLMLKLKLQYFGHLMWRVDSVEKTLMLGGIGVRRRRGDRGWDGWMASPTRWTWVWASSGSWCWTGKPVMLQQMGSQRIRYVQATELNWKYWCPLLQHVNSKRSGVVERGALLQWNQLAFHCSQGRNLPLKDDGNVYCFPNKNLTSLFFHHWYIIHQWCALPIVHLNNLHSLKVSFFHFQELL